MIRDLMLSFCLLTIFTFFFEHFMMKVNMNLKIITWYVWKVGLYQGIVGVLLMYFGHHFDNYFLADLRTIPILISSYIGGPFSAVITMLVILIFQLSYVSSIDIMIQGTIIMSLLLIISNTSVRFIKHYWMQWLISVTCSNFVILTIYYYMENPPLISVQLQYFLAYQAFGLFIAAKLYYMSNAQKLKHQFDVLQSDLLEILHLQPGLIYKLTKENGKIIYKIGGGALFEELGLCSEDIVGKSIDNISVFPDELSSFLQCQKEKAWRGEQLSFETCFAKRTLLVTLKPIYYNNNVVSVIGSAIDITERKQSERQLVESEELYRSLVESSQDFIVHFDVDGRVTSVNKKVLETFRTQPEKVIGEFITDHLPPGEHIESWLYHFNQVISGREMESFEYSFKFNNIEFDFHVTLSPFFDINQVIIGIMCTAHDIKNLKMSREADEANKAKSEFVARMSHEIRTPLSGIIGLTELLMRQEMSPVQKDYLDKILSSSNTLLRIVNDVLDFSKIEAGKIELQKVQFNLHHLMQELSDILTVLVGEKRLKFIIDTSADIPETLYGDSLRIEQILINMINNSIKFTDSGYIYVKAELLSYEDDMFYLEFSVKDTGIGLTSDQMSHLFEPFTQVGHFSKHKYGGTGLGLSICKYFIELMGGTITVNSQPGYGSKFSFTLPFDHVPLNAQIRREDPIEFSRMNVLVIESNEVVSKGICSMLESMNFQVICCDNYMNVDFSSIHLEVILTDLSKDTMNDLNDWLHLKRRTSAISVRHVVILTPMVREEIMKLPKHLQPDAIILMPVSRIGLYRTMRSLFWHKFKESTVIQRTQFNALRNRKMNILLAEDNAINQLVVTELLKSYGFSVTIANHGNEVLRLLNREQWDLLLMDIHMPELDGVATTKKIREDHRFDQLLIIALTANTVKEDHEMYYRIGMNGVLTKPLEVDQLFSLINRRDASKDGSVYKKREDQNNIEIDLQGIDIQAIRRRVNGKENILVHMFIVFLRDYRDFTNRLQETLSRFDLTNTRRMLHTLKGVAANISADGLLAAANQLESILDKGGDIKASMEHLDWEMQMIISSLQNYIDIGYESNIIHENDGERD
ncbi:ATP-binding protein [Paenibacillus sp. N3/727]|uniref:ATP-binding protein n=1 Tax=Paenibacillus sp. N3/727 TaxID=2925845 RepID=UPI001F538CBF|nr:ATP-binding protein [Paenibacillus sp. N3/727]UNK16275.1 ATP-binding protein [Paenibacillus sp. N3/727]